MNVSFKQAALYGLFMRAQAEKSEALASLSILLDHPAGIGDHSTEDLHRNLNDSLEKLVNADDKINTIMSYFPEISNQTKNAV